MRSTTSARRLREASASIRWRSTAAVEAARPRTAMGISTSRRGSGEGAGRLRAGPFGAVEIERQADDERAYLVLFNDLGESYLASSVNLVRLIVS